MPVFTYAYKRSMLRPEKLLGLKDAAKRTVERRGAKVEKARLQSARDTLSVPLLLLRAAARMSCPRPGRAISHPICALISTGYWPLRMTVVGACRQEQQCGNATNCCVAMLRARVYVVDPPDVSAQASQTTTPKIFSKSDMLHAKPRAERI